MKNLESAPSLLISGIPISISGTRDHRDLDEESGYESILLSW